MYQLHVFYTAKDQKTLQAFYREVLEANVIGISQREEGCIRYEYYFSAARDNELLIVETWKDRASQELHDSLPHLTEMMKLKEKYQIQTVVEEL